MSVMTVCYYFFTFSSLEHDLVVYRICISCQVMLNMKLFSSCDVLGTGDTNLCTNQVQCFSPKCYCLDFITLPGKDQSSAPFCGKVLIR